MSAVIETYLICDNRLCGATIGKENKHYKAGQHRKEAKLAGWVHSENLDYCPNCKRSKGRPRKEKYLEKE